MTPTQRAKDLIDFKEHIDPQTLKRALTDLYEEHMSILPHARAWQAWQVNSGVLPKDGGIL